MENNDLIKILEALASISKKIDSIQKEEPKLPTPTRSEEIHELCSALAKAQAEFKIAGRDNTNPFYSSSYADLSSIVKASRAPLAKNGLAVTQQIIHNEVGQNILHTLLSHSSGQWIESRVRIVPPKADIQSFGSYVTYLRRYSYAALVGVVASDEDDDGEAAVHESRQNFDKGTKLNHKYNPKKGSPETITKEQLEELRYELGEHTDLAEEILEKMKLHTLSDMPKEKFLPAIRRVRQIVQKREGK